MHRTRKSNAVRAAIETLDTRKLLALDLVAITDSATNFGDTRRAVVFYDVTDVRTTTSGLIGGLERFSIWTGYELTDYVGTSNDRNYEDLQALGISPDGTTAYVLAFDSGTQGVTDLGGDTMGDYDLYRLDIEAANADFVANNRSEGIMYIPRYSADFRAGNPANGGLDYQAAYGGRALGPTGLPSVTETDPGIPPGRSNADADPSNDIIWLDGVSAKVGEVVRRGAAGTTPFFDDQDIQVVDEDTIVLMESALVNPTLSGSLADDYSIRTIERESTQPGLAVVGTGDSGGYNGQATESWQSYNWTGDNYVDLDNNAGTGGISDVDGMRFVTRDGVQGVWVSDRDGGGDDFAFFGLDFTNRVATRLEQRVGTSPYPESFAIDEDPTVNAGTNDGDLSGFDIDADGNLVIRESNFLGTGNPSNTESKVITRAVANYNAGDLDTNLINELTFGAWGITPNLAPTLTDDAGPINSEYGVLHAEQGLVYYIPRDAVNSDLYVLDLATGQLVYQELDAMNHLYFSGNKLRAFRLGGGDAVPPTVALTFAFQTEQAINLNFSEALATSGAGALTASDLTLTNTTTNQVIPAADLTVVNVGGNVYKVTYKAGAATNPLPRGVYTLTLNAAGITDAAGNALTSPGTFTIKINPGDTNQDGDVDFDDLLILAQSYGSTGKNYSQGNVNYDAAGAVNFDDLLLLAQNYGTNLVQAPKAKLTAKRATASVLN